MHGLIQLRAFCTLVLSFSLLYCCMFHTSFQHVYYPSFSHCQPLCTFDVSSALWNTVSLMIAVFSVFSSFVITRHTTIQFQTTKFHFNRPFHSSSKEFSTAIMNVTSRLGYTLPPSWGVFVFLYIEIASYFEWIYHTFCTLHSKKKNGRGHLEAIAAIVWEIQTIK